jgi:hypothetical protein
MSKKLICGAFFLGFALLTQAQQHAPAVMAPRSAPIPMVRPAVAAPMAHAAPASANAANRSTSANTHASVSTAGRSTGHNASRTSLGTRPNRNPARTVGPNFVNGGVNGNGFSDEFPVPGMGFDYAHFFAVHPNWQRDHPSTGAIFPFVGGGLYLPAPYYEATAAENEPAASNDSLAAEPVSQESNEDSNPREAEPANTRVRTRSNSVPASTAPADTTEYVFVRRDGTVFFAVAYSWVDGRLQYITQDGLRKVASLDSLDLKATQEFNQQSGQTLTTPSL